MLDLVVLSELSQRALGVVAEVQDLERSVVELELELGHLVVIEDLLGSQRERDVLTELVEEDKGIEL